MKALPKLQITDAISNSIRYLREDFPTPNRQLATSFQYYDGNQRTFLIALIIYGMSFKKKPCLLLVNVVKNNLKEPSKLGRVGKRLLKHNPGSDRY